MMKFENKYIKIKNKRQEITVHNYIYDEYLSLFSKAQYLLFDIDESDQLTINRLYTTNCDKNFEYCYIKFDNELTDVKNAGMEDFDILIKITKKSIEGNESSVTTDYEVTLQEFFYDEISQETLNLNDFANKKIMAVGFGNNRTVFACVDLSNYQISIEDNEPLSIFRRDIITTDGVVDGIDLPLHLAPFSNIFKGNKIEEVIEYEPVWATLYSVGFGNVRGVMNEEFIIDKDINIIKENDKEFGFKLNKKVGNTYYPCTKIYSNSNRYPLAEYSKKEFYPSIGSYAGNSKYPLYANFKYIIYKYRLYFMYRNKETGNAKVIFLDEYYTLSYHEETAKGLFEIKTKIERR